MVTEAWGGSKCLNIVDTVLRECYRYFIHPVNKSGRKAMQMTIKKWGNSLATRIPKAVVDSIGLHLDQEVEIEAVNGKIIITPIKTIEYNLEDLLRHCKPEAMELSEEDKEWLDDPPVGKEVW
jgi:antitoxin component of MazEF toxin-antitoxin module